MNLLDYVGGEKMEVSKKFDPRHGIVYYGGVTGSEQKKGLLATSDRGVTVWTGEDRYFLPWSSVIYIQFDRISEKGESKK